MMHSKINVGLVSAGSFLATAGATLAIAAATTGGPAGAWAAPESLPVAPASAAVTAAYARLKAPDEAALSALAKPVDLQFFASREPGLNLKQAAVVVDNSETSAVILPKGTDQVCLIRLRKSGAASNNCVDQEIAITRGIWNGLPGHVNGVVPDAVREVTFSLTSGKTVVVPAADGYVEAPAEAVGATLVNAGKTYSLDELVPASQVPESTHILD